MSSDNLKFELLQAEDYSQYLLTNPQEILQVLSGLVQKRCLMTAYLEGDGDSFLTAVLEVDGAVGRLVFDLARDEAMNARALAATRMICVSQLERVKIQFALSRIERVAHRGGSALAAPIPDTVLRLQRREYFRLVAPVTHSLTCTIPITTADGGTVSCDARIIDISGGGVAVMVPPQGVELAPGMEFPGCHLALPGSPIVTTLCIRNLFRITNRNGVTMIRAGCQFRDLPASATALIQRYIFKAERDRSARERGL